VCDSTANVDWCLAAVHDSKDYGAYSETGLRRPRSEPPSIDEYGGRIVTGVPIWCVIQRPT